MKIKEIYDEFGVHPNLRRHMLRVALLTEFLAQHWMGETIDRETLKKAALLHDLSNLLKSDLEKNPEILAEEQIRLDLWKTKLKDLLEKYGTDEHAATIKMLNEIGVSKKIIELVNNKSFGNSINVEKSNNWELKMLLYADMRVVPSGFSSLEERLSDVTSRIEKYRIHPLKDELIQACRVIEQEIEQRINVPIDSFTEGTEVQINNLLESEV